MASFSERLVTAMKECGMSQAALSAASGIPKSAINQYVHSINKPKQSRTFVLAKTLGVSPAWLMGYDDLGELSAREAALVEAYRSRPDLRARIDALLDERSSTASIFRAAKSKGGVLGPTTEELPLSRLRTLENAPETDEDL